MAQTPYPQTDRELMRLIERSPGHRAGYKQLIRELGLGGGRERRLLLEQLARITARGELTKTDSEQWSLPAAAPEKTKRVKRGVGDAAVELPVEHRATRDRLIAGRLDLHRDGYGFVRPTQSTSREDDLFIPPNELNGAMQGDEVLVDEAPPGRDGRRSGRVARVLNRRNPTVVGIFHYARGQRGAEIVGGNYITPLDERMAGSPGGGAILIPEGAETPATGKETPHRVLGEEAVAQQTHWADELDPHRPLEGLAVDVEITDFPTTGRPARGRVIEVLGPPDAFGVDVEIIIRKHHLPHVFPTNVLAEATASAALTVETLEPSVMLPQVAQGALAVECRADDGATRRTLAVLDDPQVRREVEAERAFLAELGGGCTLPVGAFAVPAVTAAGDPRGPGPAALRLTGMLAGGDGHVVLFHRASGTDGPALGRAVARYLLDDAGGADLGPWSPGS